MIWRLQIVVLLSHLVQVQTVKNLLGKRRYLSWFQQCAGFQQASYGMTLLRKLFIWDFDKTIVLDDTDRTAVQTLAPHIVRHYLQNEERVRRNGWTSVMNDAFASLISIGHTPQEIISAAACSRFPQATANALQSVATSSEAANAIISDSNSAFIHACLSRLYANTLFAAGIHTNPAYVDSSSIYVTPYCVAHNNQHQCATCPPNLCKGNVMETILKKYSPRPIVIYIGDGFNDYCPVSHLIEDDVVIYRSGFSLEKLIKQNEMSIAARTIAWETPEILNELVKSILQG